MVLRVSDWSCSVVSDSLQPHGLQPIRFLCPWDSPAKNTGVDCHFLLQGIFPTQGSNRGLRHCRQTLYPLPSKLPGSVCSFKSMFTFALILMVWLTSLAMITSRSIHVAANGIVLFFMAEWYSIVCVCVFVCVYHILFNHSSVKGHLVYFHVLAINVFFVFRNSILAKQNHPIH